MITKWIELYYGQSGTGKSESIVSVIKRIYQETGKTARVLVGDGSAATYAGVVEAGIAEILDYTTRDWPLSTLKQLCEGFWPADVLDPKSKMVAMTADQFAKIGVNAIEGLSVGSNYVMGDKKGGFSERAARGEKIAGDSPLQLVDQELNANGQLIPNSGPGFKFGGVTLGGYGHAQRRMLGFVEASKALPGWVIWTAHEKSAEDKVSNEKLIGPEVAGGALTAGMSKHFNNTLHFATAQKKAKQADAHTGANVDIIDSEYRIYTRDHFRPEGNNFVKYKVVTRHPDPNGNKFPVAGVEPSKLALPLYFESDIPGKSILDFYEHIKLAREREKKSLQAA